MANTPCLALVRVTLRAEDDVIGAQLCSCTKTIFPWLTLSRSDWSTPLIIVDNSPSMHNTGFFPNCYLLSVLSPGLCKRVRNGRCNLKIYIPDTNGGRIQHDPRGTLRHFPKDTELALGMTLLELHWILQIFCVRQENGNGVNRGS